MRAFYIDLPADGSASYTIRTTLEGKEYELKFDYNGREDRWYSTLSFSGRVIMSGKKVVSNLSLFEFSPDADAPPGELIVVKKDNAPIRFSDLGKNASLFYLTSNE